jgi:probable HAF family extracellular repeat protein
MDLGTLPTEICSNAVSINQSGQILGYSTPFCGSETYHPFLWENGAMYDVRALIVPGSDITLGELFEINDRGEMVGFGLTPNGDLHTVVLVPQGDCDDACKARIADSHINPPAIPVRAMTSELKAIQRARFASRNHLPNPGPHN